ncbi:hypothetical protein LCGC14_3045590, partial [marine sediment metagenome]
MKLSRISRVVRLLTLLQSEHSYSPDELAKHIGVSRRTVFRDLKELEAVGVPFKFNSDTGGYTIDPEYFLPSIDLNLQEALSLLMLVHKASGHLPLPFKNSALLGGLKIENNLPDEIRRYCNATLANISIRADSHAPMDLLDNIFARLQKAVRKRVLVKMVYNSVFDGKEIAIRLSPYHIMYNNRAWYVIGHSSLHKEVRTFKLNRIKELTVLAHAGIRSGRAGFDVHDYLGMAWSMIPEGRMYNVKLRFLPKVANNVTEVRWHSTQKVTHNTDGSATVEFRVDGLG